MRKYIAMILAGALLAACGGSAAPGGNTKDKTSVADTRWFLYSLHRSGGEHQWVNAYSAAFILQFESAGRVAGFADCNVFSGEYSELNNAVYISPLAIDTQLCPSGHAAQVEEVVGLLSEVAWFEREAGRLTLRTYEEDKLMFEPLFPGCSDELIVTGEHESGAIAVTGVTLENAEALATEYAANHADFRVVKGPPALVAVMSANTLHRLRCDARVSSLSYSSELD